MNEWKRRTGAALVLLAVTAAPVWAAAPDETMQPILIAAPISAPMSALKPVEAKQPLPSAVEINGASVSFDQAPVVSDGVLMLPLRAIVEAGGGNVTWDADTHTVTARLGDRTAYFVIGNGAAEMNQDNVRYIQRNMIQMAKAPAIVGNRTLVSADSLTVIFDVMAQTARDSVLRLVAKPAPVRPDVDNVMTGTIEQFAGTDKGLRMLVKGAPMSSGEASMTWFAITDQTAITVMENGAQRSGTTSDLLVGKRVEVRPTGPLLMSYPAQGGAAAITVTM